MEFLKNDLTWDLLCDTLKKAGDHMFRDIQNVRIVNVGYRISVRKETVRNRKYHALFYKAEGQSYYEFENKTFVFPTDSVVLLPKGSNYYYENCGDTDGSIYFVTFECACDPPLEPTLFTFKNPADVHRLFMKMRQSFRFGGKIERLNAYSYFYKLLALLERKLENSESTGSDLDRIEAAVDYLQEHLFDPALRITDLHEMCGMSAPSFRRAFAERFSCTPKKYVLQQRMREARELLKDGDFKNIARVATAVGFEDQLYFSKCFKSFFGVAPSQYKYE